MWIKEDNTGKDTSPSQLQKFLEKNGNHERKY
jgi:hypothetical protein